MGIGLFIEDEFVANIVDYTVQEDSTPLSPLDNSGGVSELTVSVAEIDNPGVLMNKQVDMADTVNGELRVTLNDVKGDLNQSTFSGTTIMQRLNSTIYVPPAMNVKLSDYLASILTAVGISMLPQYKNSVGDLRVTAPGWRGVLWDQLKSLCSMYKIEIAAIAEQLVVRSVGGRIAETSNIIDANWSIDHSNLVTTLKVVNYNASAYTSETILYPKTLGTGQLISADPNETVKVTLESDFSIATIVAPQYGELNKYETTVASRFAVTNGKNKVLTPDQFYAGGGSLTAKIDPTDDKQIIITFKAPNYKNDGPFRVGMVEAPGSKTLYSTLRVTGTGVKSVPKEYTIKTGIPSSYVTQVTEAKVDNIFAYNSSKAFALAQAALCDIATYNYTLTVNTDYVNRLGETGLITARTYEEFNAESGTETYTEFNTNQGTKTYKQWQAENKIGDADLFENQAFGNVAGARHEFRDSMFRIRSATITPDSISYTAEQDTTHADFMAVWDDDTSYADFQAMWGDTSYLEFGVRPLWRP